MFLIAADEPRLPIRNHENGDVAVATRCARVVSRRSSRRWTSLKGIARGRRGFVARTPAGCLSTWHFSLVTHRANRCCGGRRTRAP